MQVNRRELIAIARDVVRERGGQVKVAEILGVSQPYVANALRADPESETRDGLLVRIVSEAGGRKVERRVVFDVE